MADNTFHILDNKAEKFNTVLKNSAVALHLLAL